MNSNLNFMNDIKASNKTKDLSKYDLQYSLNELTHILDNSDTLERKIKYTPEMVTVIEHRDGNNKSKYFIEYAGVKKLAESEDITSNEALDKVKNMVTDNVDKANIVEDDGFGVFVNTMANIEDLGSISKAIDFDPAKIDKVASTIDMTSKELEDIKEAGYGLYVRRV